MLEKLRTRIEPIVDQLGMIVSKLKISPMMLSNLALMCAILSGIYYSKIFDIFIITNIRSEIIAGLFLLLSGIFDILDGSVARITNSVSNKGSFIDSTFDRISEIFIFSGILLGEYTEPIFVLGALSFSLMVSYSRAKADSINITLKGIGIGERSERLLILIIGSFLLLIEEAILIILIIAIITTAQRFFSVMKKL